MADIEIKNYKKNNCGIATVVPYVTFFFGFFFSCLFPICICVNIKQIKGECIKKLQKIKRHANHIVLYVYFFLEVAYPLKNTVLFPLA